MAIVRTLSRRQLDVDVRHTETECTFSVVTDKSGEEFLQIDTYGSSLRKIAGKKSQSIRFSRTAMLQLKQIFEQFDLTR
jgi:hypothetical protein